MRAVRKLRLLVLLILLVIMTLGTVGVYRFSSNKEASTFQNEFAAHGLAVIAAFRDESAQKLQALDSLSAVATAYALKLNDTRPFVTIAHSAQLLERYLSMADAAAINILPIVHFNQKKQWKEFSVL